MQVKTLIISALLLLGVGYGVGRYLQPAEVKIEIKEVIKEVEVENRNVVTIIREIERPDGTREIETRIVDKTTIEKDRTASRSEVKTVRALKPQWKVGAMVGQSDFLRGGTIYGAQVERRILGPFFLGVWGNTNKSAGLSISMEL